MKSGHRLLLIFGVLTALVVAFLCATSSDAQASTARAASAVPGALEGAVADSRNAIAGPVLATQRSMAEAAAPVLVAAQDVVVEAMPALPAPPAASTHQGGAVSPAAVDMIVGFEIVSRTYYAKRLQRPVWPKGASGVTWGIGYDGGHQAAHRIRADWSMHPDRDALARTAGVIGTPAQALARELRAVVTPLPMAEQVFAESTLPAYASQAERAFRQGWTCIGADPQGALVATAYTRGTSMRGNSRREMRELRDECVPRCDTGCMAAAFRSMKRLWVGTPLEAGLARRYEATARLAEGAGA
jgi:hypothetical protein